MLNSVKNRKTEKNGQNRYFNKINRYLNDAFVIISHLKASYLYVSITKDEKNQGKTEEILLEFVSSSILRVHCQVWSAMLKWKASIPQILTS